MRDPTAHGWPDGGQRTTSRDIAERWRLHYWDLVEGETRRRTLGRPRERRLRDAVAAWLEHREQNVAPGTVQNDRSALGHLLDAYPHAKLHDLTSQAVQAVLDRLTATGYARTTIKVYAGALSVFAERHGLDVDLVSPAPHHAPAEPLSDAEVATVIDKARSLARVIAKDARWSIDPASVIRAVHAGLYMGLRQGEIFGLFWVKASTDGGGAAGVGPRTRRGAGGVPTRRRAGAVTHTTQHRHAPGHRLALATAHLLPDVPRPRTRYAASSEVVGAQFGHHHRKRLRAPSTGSCRRARGGSDLREMNPCAPSLRCVYCR